MEKEARKRAIAAFKDRETGWGVFAVLCTANGQNWVGTSTHVATQRNGLWFSLRLGTSPFGTLQTAWREHGETHFRFEELERLRGDHSPLDRKTEVEKRADLWRRRLAAEPL